MPNKRSALKELRKGKKQTARNLRSKRAVKTLAKQILKDVESGNIEAAQKAFPAFQKAVDKAAKNNVIKKNTAARKKSRINTRIKRSGK